MGMPYGLQAMLKEGHKHLSGLEEAVLKNIEACKQLANITRTSMGPNGEFFASFLPTDCHLHPRKPRKAAQTHATTT